MTKASTSKKDKSVHSQKNKFNHVFSKINEPTVAESTAIEHVVESITNVNDSSIDLLKNDVLISNISNEIQPSLEKDMIRCHLSELKLTILYLDPLPPFKPDPLKYSNVQKFQQHLKRYNIYVAYRGDRLRKINKLITYLKYKNVIIADVLTSSEIYKLNLFYYGKYKE